MITKKQQFDSQKKIFIFSIRTLIGVFIVTAILIFIGVFTFNGGLRSQSAHANWINNQSFISKLTSDRAYVNHEVDGFTYQDCELNTYSSSYYINQQILIQYNPNNPYEVMTQDSSAFLINVGIALLTIGCALPFIYAGGAGLIELYKKKVAKINNDPNNKPPTDTYTNNHSH